MIRTHYTEEQISEKRAAIKKAVLNNTSEHLTRIDCNMVRSLIRQYDRLFFGDLFKENNINFEIKASNQMTSVGGKIGYRRQLRYLSSPEERLEYLNKRNPSFALTLSGAVICSNFSKPGSTEKVNGLTATSRFEALSFIVEHELIHAIDSILHGHSGHGANFQRLAKSFFGHTDYHHEIGKTAISEQTDEELEREFAACAKRAGVSEEIFGVVLKWKGHEIKVIGINTKRSKYPFTGVDQYGKNWKLSRNQVQQAYTQQIANNN